MKSIAITGTALIVGLAVACSSSDDTNKTGSSSGAKASSGYTDHSSPYPDCDQIIKACHPFDVGEGQVHDCHDQGHGARSEADCTPVKQMCLDICAAAAAAADGGTTTDAGTDAQPASQ